MRYYEVIDLNAETVIYIGSLEACKAFIRGFDLGCNDKVYDRVLKIRVIVMEEN